MINNKKLTLEELEDQFSIVLGRFIGPLTHDIKNPLTIINAHLYRLKKEISENKIDPEAILGKLTKIENSSKKIDLILNNLRSVYKDSIEIDTVLLSAKVNLLIQPLLYSAEVTFIEKADSHILKDSRFLFLTLIKLVDLSLKDLNSNDNKIIRLKIQKSATKLFFTIFNTGKNLNELACTKEQIAFDLNVIKTSLEVLKSELEVVRSPRYGNHYTFSLDLALV